MGLENDLRNKGITFRGGVNDSLEYNDPNGKAILRIAELHRSFDGAQKELLHARGVEQDRLDEGWIPDFPELSDSNYEVTSALHPSLETRHVELTGPISGIDKALNSGADNWMGCLEDACARAPDIVDSSFTQLHLAATGQNENVKDSPTTTTIRPAGLYSDSHMFVDGEIVSAHLYDLGMIFSLVAPGQYERGKPTSLYIPKYETGGESRFLNNVIHDLIDGNMPPTQVQLSFLIENFMAIINMDKIIEGSKDMIVAANVGRWDYAASILYKFRNHPDMAMPDSDLINMTTDLMMAYQKRFLYLCDLRGIQPIGGMAAQVPTRGHPQREDMIASVKEDALREVLMGFYGKWSAHPLTVPIVKEVFMQEMRGKSSQPYKFGHEDQITVEQLMQVPEGKRTYQGLVKDFRTQIEYLAHYKARMGAFAMDGISMVDLAIAEIGRNNATHSLIHSQKLEDGKHVDGPLVYNAVGDALVQLGQRYTPEKYTQLNFREAANDVIQFVVSGHRNVQYFPKVVDPMIMKKTA